MIHTSKSKSLSSPASNTKDSLRWSGSPFISSNLDQGWDSIDTGQGALGADRVCGYERGDTEDIVGGRVGTVQWDLESVAGAEGWVGSLKLDGDGGERWAGWRVGCGAGDGDDSLGRSDGPGVGGSLDEDGLEVDGVDDALGGDVDGCGCDGGDG